MIDWKLPKYSKAQRYVMPSSKFNFEKFQKFSLSTNQHNFFCLILSLDSKEILQSLLKI